MARYKNVGRAGPALRPTARPEKRQGSAPCCYVGVGWRLCHSKRYFSGTLSALA